MLKKILPMVLAILFVAFPFVIHYGLNYADPVLFAVLLFVLLMLRIALTPSDNNLGQWIMGVITTVYCGSIALFDSELLLRYYPVLISLYVALLFFITLFDRESLIEQFAKLSGKSYPDGARLYMRNLTKLWVLLLVVNASIAVYSACCMSKSFWLLYNGIISYVIVLGFIAAEIIFRQYYRRKYFPEWD